MAKILCVTSGLAGRMFRTLELARRLRVAGHHLTYASVPKARSTIEDQGIAFLPLAPDRYDTFLRADADRPWWTRLQTIRARQRDAIEAVGVATFAETVATLRPDLVIIDLELHEQIIVAASARARVALVSSFVSVWPDPGVPPPHHLVRPGVGWRGSPLGIRLLWLQLRWRKLWRRWSHRVTRLGCDRVSILRRLAHDLGFDFDREIDPGQWLIPFTYPRFPMLCVRARELEFPHQPRPNVHYLGPMIAANRRDPRVTPDAQRRLDTIVARREDGQRKLIYAGFGSFFSTAPDLVVRLVKAVAGRPEWDLVISLGGQPLPSALADLPPNVHSLHWVPQLEVLRRADAAVIHGGNSTVDECITAGVPMLVYCGFETDMGGTTARVWHHGLGHVGDPQHDDPETIANRVAQVMTDGRLRRNLDQFRAAYARYAEQRVAEHTVESLLQS